MDILHTVAVVKVATEAVRGIAVRLEHKAKHVVEGIIVAAREGTRIPLRQKDKRNNTNVNKAGGAHAPPALFIRYWSPYFTMAFRPSMM